MVEFEGEPQSISDISRYYSDILYAENQSINLFMSFEQLLNSLPFSTDLSATVLYDQKFMQHQLVAEPRAAKERMALMPFLHIGPLLEDSNVPTADVKQWYDDAVTGVSWLVNEEHDTVCLGYAGGTLEHLACATSRACPQRFLERYLSDGVNFPNFQDKMYKERPERAAAIASDKVEIGIKHKILPQDSSDTAWQAYCRAYDDYICEMLGLLPLNIDKNTSQ